MAKIIKSAGTGSTTITATYGGKSATATLTVTNATIGITVTKNQSYTYDNNPHGTGVTATTVNGQTATIKYGTTSGTYNLNAAPTYKNAGTYTVYYQVTANYHTTVTDSYTIVINKATGYATATTSNKTYNGTAQTVASINTNSGSYYFGFGSSSTSAPTSWGTVNTAAQATNAGTYYVWVKCAESTNYNAVSAKYVGAVTISKATPGFGVTGQTVVYHNTAYIKAYATVLGKIYYGTSTSSMTTPVTVSAVGSTSNYNTTVTSRTEVGTTTIYAYFVPTDSANYNSVSSSGSTAYSASAKVTQGTDAEMDVVVTTSLTYTGSLQTIAQLKNWTDDTHGVANYYLGYTTSASATVDSVNWSGPYTAAATLQATAAGTYYIWYKFTADSSHSNSESGKKLDATCTIGKATQPMTISPTSKTIYNTDGYNTVTIKPSNAQGTVTYASSNTSVAKVSTAGVVTYVAAGTATITVTAAGNSNYNSGSKTCAITCTVDTEKSYSAISGTLTVSQKTQLPAGGITLTTANIGNYVSYDGSNLSQTITWASGNTTTNKTFTYTWSGNNVSIASLGTTLTTAVTARTVAFTITATGKGTNTTPATVKSLNQAINSVTNLVLSLSKNTIAYGETSTPTVTATFASGSSTPVTDWTDTTIESSNTSVATIQ